MCLAELEWKVNGTNILRYTRNIWLRDHLLDSRNYRVFGKFVVMLYRDFKMNSHGQEN